MSVLVRGRAGSEPTFWSESNVQIDLPAVAADTDLPDVTISTLPDDIVIVRVIGVLKIRAIENTNAGGTNAIKGAQTIRIKKSTGTWGLNDVALIDLTDNLWLVAASTRESGDVVWGDNDVSSVVDGNATYNIRFENALVDLASLRLNGVLVGLKVEYQRG